jgi:3-dehydroquinate dehydratase-1
MRPCVETPLNVRGLEYGGARPLFCVPLVAADLGSLLAQAGVAHSLSADLIEWRTDFFQDATAKGFADSLSRLRSVLPNEPIIFTLRIKAEGGAREMPQDAREASIESVAATGLADIIDIELCNDTPFVESVVRVAHENGVRVILSFHDFEKTPANEELLAKISLVNLRGGDIAKIAVMPQTHSDVLRLLEVTLQARRCLPRLPLCTMAMGRLGILSRVAGFLFGSDMAYAVGQESSAPGQIPIAEARAISEGLLKYAG